MRPKKGARAFVTRVFQNIIPKLSNNSKEPLIYGAFVCTFARVENAHVLVFNARQLRIEFFLAGATAIQVGTANFIDPAISAKIVTGIDEYLNRHGFDSGMILNKIKGFQDIARIASLHHETLDGKGYPYHLTAEHIPIEARIVTTADIFQALVQNRPYRVGMSAEEALTIMTQMTKEHKLDERIILILSKHLEEAYLQAIKPETTTHGN
jgi:hypothetical protein